MNKGTTSQSPVIGLILKQMFFPWSPSVGRIHAVLDSDETSAALAAAAAVAELTAEGVDVDLCVEQGLAQVCVAVYLDEGAAVLLHYLDGVGLGLGGGAEGRGRGARA